ESRVLTDRDEVIPRESVRYSLVLRNSGLRSAPNAQLTGELPAALRYVPDSLTCSGGACRMDGQTLDWRGAIAPTQAVTVTLEAVLETPLPDLTPVAWAVELADGFGTSYPLAATFQARRSNLAPTTLDLRPAYVAPGQSSWLTVRIFNAGHLPAAVLLSLDLPPGLVFDPASVSCGSGVCGVDGRTLSWQGTLAARSLVLVRLMVRTPDDAVYGTMFAIEGRIVDETWGDSYELTATLVASRNLFLPTLHGRDGSMEQQLYLPFVP
ncbi:MAG: DUF11 domain-containing protein, partial [Caldilineaceae bacterium]|nr:DUF11 domain-containing protein [Caldilineaceae bacterium]